jgi:uncharacterized repeat protein (TIGR03803 family)
MKLLTWFLCAVVIAMAPISGLILVATGAEAAFDHQLLKSFGFADLMGQGPAARLIEGTDGCLYGTSVGGAPRDLGTVFKLNKDGSGNRVLHRFGSVEDDGIYPAAGLVEASDGALYGTTPRGGSNLMGGVILNGGTVFTLNKDGSGYRILHSFGSAGDGENPQGELIEGSDGKLYGTTVDGGAGGSGTVFRLNKDGSDYSILHDFSSFAWPGGALVEGTDGALYGTSQRDGTNGAGTVFRMDKDGSGFGVLHHFAGSFRFDGDDGAFPRSTLLQASDGALYGTTTVGGTTNSGTVFKLNPDGSDYSVLHSFNIYDADGSYPDARIVEGSNGKLYGTTSNSGTGGGGTIFMLNMDGTGFTTLHWFSHADAGGNFPSAGLLEGSDGALYGTAGSGGSNGVGTVFSLDHDGRGFRVLRSFVFAGGDGVNPQVGLVEGRDGSLYGVTPNGGVGDCQGSAGQRGCGTVFKVSKDGGGYRLLHQFSSGREDGQEPAGLIEGSDGTLYGTTVAGGGDNAGTVFKLNPDGSRHALLHSFSNSGSGGNRPQAGVIQGRDGALYGATSSGGSNFSGTVFKLNTDGLAYTVLHTFTSRDGRPQAKLIEGSDGALYGTTYEGGSNGFGGVFKLNKDGSGYLILHSFKFDRVDGIRPSAELMEGSDGGLFGTTGQGGTSHSGTVFRLNKDGSNYRVLHSFGPGYSGDGEYPGGGLVEGSDGALYGTTVYGGGDIACTGGCGTVFKLNKDGSGYTNFIFGAISHDGKHPVSSLIQGSDGGLYGTTQWGGQLGLGTVFRVRSLLPAIFESSMWFDGEGFRFSIRGQAGLRVRIQRSVDLTTWEDWLIIALDSDPVELADPSAGSRSRQFYRAVSP